MKLIPKHISGALIRKLIPKGKSLQEFFDLAKSRGLKNIESKLSKHPEEFVTKVVQEDGKVRLRLPNHTSAKARELRLDPQGNNQFYTHIRTWDGEKIPANISPLEKKALYEALYKELPEGGEILFPKSSKEFLGTRGTVAGLKRMEKDSRFIKGKAGQLMYKDKDGSIKVYEGHGFIKN